jgi:arsenate reductase
MPWRGGSKVRKNEAVGYLRALIQPFPKNQSMRKIYYLSSCSTCQQIIKQLDLVAKGFEMQDIKEKNITANELDAISTKVGSYEALFSKRALKFRGMGLDKMTLTEKDYRTYILEEYTFMKRPFILIGDEVFVGNSKSTIAEAAKAL